MPSTVLIDWAMGQGMKSTRRRILSLGSCILVVTSVCLSANVHAAEVRVAVAANFTAPMAQIAATFEKSTGHRLLISYGSTGRLFAQISNGAPFEVLLAADSTAPAKLEASGLTVKGSRMTYAIGRLVLWSPLPTVVDSHADVLRRGDYTRLAIAAPLLAPYGAAAVQTLERLGLRAASQPKWVTGESIGQAYSLVATGNAQLGFVAASQVFSGGKLISGSAWLVPADLHSPIRQEAVLLNRAQSNLAARALLTYLKSDAAKAIMASFGYEAPKRQ